MNEQYLLGLDFGGSGGRCLVLALESGQVTVAHRAWQPRTTAGTGGLGFDLDLESLWNRLGQATREALDRAGARPDQVLSVAATGMRFGLVLLDARGQEIFAVPNRDGRASVQGIQLRQQHGAEIHEQTGHWPSPIFTAARLAWASTQESLWRRAAHALSLSDWVTYRLCGERVTDPSQAGETLLLDLESNDWNAGRIERLGLRRGLLPPVRPCGTPIGVLHADAAKHLGLKQGTPVAMGGADTQCGLLGAGAVEPGDLAAVAGTTAPVQQVLDKPQLHPEGRLWTGRHVVPNRWVLESNAGPAGEVLEWLARVIYPDAPFPIARLCTEAATARPGSGGILSSFGTEVMNARELGIPMGALALTHIPCPNDPMTRSHLERAVLEGMAFGLRANIDQILEVSGNPPEKLHLTGGLSRSRLWCDILADLLGWPVQVPATPEASAMGAAICAGRAAGVFPDLVQGAHRLVERAREHAPTNPGRYASLFEGWKKVRQARAEADTLAANLALQAIVTAPEQSRAIGVNTFRPRILVTADLEASGLDALRELGEVDYQSYREVGRLLTGPALVEALRGFHVLITEVDLIDGAALLELPQLRAIASCRGNAINVDVESCSLLGIPVLNTPGRNAAAVADLTLGYILALARKLFEANAYLRIPGGEAGDMGRMGRAFQTLRGHELGGRTIGLVGLGAVGRGVVQRARAFGARVVAFDPFLDEEQIQAADAEPLRLDELLRTSDFVSLHAAVSEQSRGIIGAPQLACMKPGACLINSARAALVDSEALLAALRSGHLAGAALDVFPLEPPAADDPLLQCPNVIATPHIGGNTFEVATHQGQILAQDLDRLLHGEAPQHLLNPTTLEPFDWEGTRRIPTDAECEAIRQRPAPSVSDPQEEPQAPRPNPARSRPRALETSPDRPAPAAVREIEAKMRRIIERFIEGMKQDRSLREFAVGKNVILHFVMTDLALEFHFGFVNDQVIGDPASPAEPAPVQLRMPTNVLDGMLTGRVNAMQSAMDGELSFSGDTAKAMTIQHIQTDMSRVYQKAREQFGDPGDLRILSSTPAQPSAPEKVSEDDPRIELVQIVNQLYAVQLITATGGNASLRVPGSEDQIWITPSRLFKGDLRPEILVRVTLDGEPLEAGSRSPSSEVAMHTALYLARPEIQAILHAHAPNATVLVDTDLEFLPISTEAAFFGNIGRVPFIMPGTLDLARAVVEAVGDGWACLLQNHGILVAGRNLRRAADMAEIIERTAKIILACHAVGREPRTLPPETVELLSKMGDVIA